MQKNASFLPQIDRNILKLSECVNLCLRFKRTSSAGLASFSLCMHATAIFQS